MISFSFSLKDNAEEYEKENLPLCLNIDYGKKKEKKITKNEKQKQMKRFSVTSVLVRQSCKLGIIRREFDNPPLEGHKSIWA